MSKDFVSSSVLSAQESDFGHDFIEFLRPQSESYLFLFLMASVFVVGAIGGSLRRRESLQRLQGAIERYSTDHGGCAAEAPDRYLLIETRPEEARRWFGPVPGILVTLGILGTFIGIGIAISHAIPALKQGSNPEDVQTALSALLEAVKFKFQTSAFGILFSLLFVVLAARLEMSLFSHIEQNAAELVKNRRDLTKELLDGLQMALKAALEAGFGTLSTKMDVSLQALTKSTSAMGQQASMIASGVRTLKGAVDGFSSTVAQTTVTLAESSRQLGNLGQQVDSSLGRISTALSEQLARMAESQNTALEAMVKAQRDGFAESASKLDASLKSGATTQAAAFTRIEGRLQQSLSQLGAAVGQQRQALEGSLEALNQGVTTALGEMTRVIGAMASHQETVLEHVKEYQSKAASALESVAYGLKQLDGNTNKFLAVIDKWKPTAERVLPKGNRSEDEGGSGGAPPATGSAAPPAQAKPPPRDGGGSGGAPPATGSAAPSTQPNTQPSGGVPSRAAPAAGGSAPPAQPKPQPSGVVSGGTASATGGAAPPAQPKPPSQDGYL